MREEQGRWGPCWGGSLRQLLTHDPQGRTEGAKEESQRKTEAEVGGVFVKMRREGQEETDRTNREV